jgi:hypothetical protein
MKVAKLFVVAWGAGKSAGLIGSESAEPDRPVSSGNSYAFDEFTDERAVLSGGQLCGK